METACRYSDGCTPRKQHTLALLSRSILSAICRRRPVVKKVTILDLAGGEGRYPRLKPADPRYQFAYAGRWILASPPVLLQALSECKLETELVVYEVHADAFMKLREVMRGRQRGTPRVAVKLHRGDCRKLAKTPEGTSVFYCDLSGGLFPFALLCRLLNGHKHADGLMFFNAGGHKRQVGSGRGMPLTAVFKDLKKRHIYVQLRKLDRQYVFIYATDQEPPAILIDLDFHNIKTAKGKQLLHTITHNADGDQL